MRIIDVEIRMQEEPLVLDTLVAMQRHADAVRHGFRLFTSGTVPVTRALRLVRRFEALYEVNLHRNTRARRRQRGEGSALLFLYRLPDCIESEDPMQLGWTLLVSDGVSRARERELLLDAFDSRHPLTIGPYELVRMTRKGQGKPALTYRMTRPYYEAYREKVIRSARGDVHESAHALLKALYSEPGWASVRSAVGRIVALWRREFRHRRGKSERFPALPKLRYIQRLPTTATPLRTLLNQQRSLSRIPS